MKNIVISSFFLLLLSCNSSNFFIKENDSISVTEKENIKKNMALIYEDMLQHKLDHISTLIDSSNYKEITTIFDSAYAHFSFDTCTYFSPLDQYLIKNSPDFAIDSVTSVQHEYVYRFKPSLYSYVYLLPIHVKNKKYTWLLSCVFSKNQDKWKLSKVNMGYYTYNGFTSEDYYRFSKQKYEEGKLLSAYFYTHFIVDALAPGMDDFHYENENEMNTFCNNVVDETYKKIFPLSIKDIKGEPVIWDINTHFHGDGLYSYIFCKSKISIHDTVALRNIANAINEFVGKQVPEINMVNDTIGYRFYDDTGVGINKNGPHCSVFLPVVKR